MKKHLLITTLLIFAFCNAHTQDQSVIGIGWQYSEPDSLRNFSISTSDNDLAFEKLKTIFGEPIKETSGSIIWENKKIDGINHPVTITIIDGFLSTPNKITTYKTFGSYEEKTQVLKNLKEYQMRHTKMTLLDENNKNFVKNPNSEKIVYDYLTRILSE